MLTKYRKRMDYPIEVYYMRGEEEYAQITMCEMARIAALLFLREENQTIPHLRAILVPTRREYERLVVNLLGVPIEIPSNPGRIAQPQRTDLVFLSPLAYKEHSIYEYHREEYERLIYHELVHVWEEYYSPAIEESPLWWSEGLAIYKSRQWMYEDQFNFLSPVFLGIAKGEIPKLHDINQSRDLSYHWGFTLVIEN